MSLTACILSLLIIMLMLTIITYNIICVYSCICMYTCMLSTSIGRTYVYIGITCPSYFVQVHVYIYIWLSQLVWTEHILVCITCFSYSLFVCTTLYILKLTSRSVYISIHPGHNTRWCVPSLTLYVYLSWVLISSFILSLFSLDCFILKSQCFILFPTKCRQFYSLSYTCFILISVIYVYILLLCISLSIHITFCVCVYISIAASKGLTHYTVLFRWYYHHHIIDISLSGVCKNSQKPHKGLTLKVVLFWWY